MRPTALQCVRGGLRPHFKPVCSGRRAAGAAPAPAPQRWGLRPRPQIVRGSLFGALRPCLRYAHRWHLPNKPLLRSTADAGMTTGTLLDTGILCRRGAGGTGCGSSGRGRGGDAPRKSPSSGTGAGYPLGVPRKAAQTAPNRLRFLRSGARGQRAPQKPEQRHRGRVPFGRAAQSSPNRPEPAAVPPVGGAGATRPAKARAAAQGPGTLWACRAKQPKPPRTGCGSSGRGHGGNAPRKSPSSGTGAGCPLGVPRKAAQTAPNRLRFLRSGARGRRAPQKPEQRHKGRVPFGRAAQSSPNRPEPAAVPPVGGAGATRPAKARAAAQGPGALWACRAKQPKPPRTGCGSSGRGHGGDAPRKSPSSGAGATRHAKTSHQTTTHPHTKSAQRHVPKTPSQTFLMHGILLGRKSAQHVPSGNRKPTPPAKQEWVSCSFQAVLILAHLSPLGKTCSRSRSPQPRYQCRYS